MSRSLAALLARLCEAGTLPMRPKRRQATLALLSERLEQSVRVATPQGGFTVVCPSARALHDPQGFGLDEPEMVDWIGALPKGARFWDIGANIGLYSLYAARCGLAVTAFEPSAASFAALVRNAEANGMDGDIAAYCLAFDEAERLDTLHMASSAAGHSMHSFGGADTIEGQAPTRFRQAVPGYSVDGFRRLFGVPAPQHIKLDVDGLEPAILRGAEATLAEVTSVMVEIDGSAREAGGGAIAALLEAAGLRRQPAPPEARNTLFLRGA